MSIVKNSSNNIQERRLIIGIYSGIIGLICTPILMIVAYFMEPTYQPLLQTISKLGITPNGEYVFIMSTIVGGLSIILFHYFSLQDKSVTDRNLQYARIFGIISGFGLIGVGIVQDYNDLIHQVPHWLSAFSFFFLTFLFIVFFCKFLRENNFNQNFKFTYNLAIFTELIAIFYIAISLFTQKMTFLMIEFKMHVILQKLTVVSFIIWYIFLFYDLKKNSSLIIMD